MPKKTINLTPDQQRVLTNVVFAETAGGPPEEVAAAASAYLNRVEKEGFERAMAGSSAYKFRSKQFVKATTGDLTPYEKAVWAQHNAINQQLIANPDKILPFTHHENVRAFGEPSWAKDAVSFQDIGRQRFYVLKEKPRARTKAVQTKVGK